MKKELYKSMLISGVFISAGLFVSFFVFFLMFGKGLQILIPYILFAVYLVIFFVLRKLPFIKKYYILQLIIAVAFAFIFIMLM